MLPCGKRVNGQAIFRVPSMAARVGGLGGLCGCDDEDELVEEEVER